MLMSLEKNKLVFKILSILLIALLILPIVMHSTSDIVEASELNNMTRRSRIPIWIGDQLVGWLVGRVFDWVAAGVAGLSLVGQAALLNFAVIAGLGVISYHMYNPNAVDYAKYSNQCILTSSGHSMCPTGA